MKHAVVAGLVIIVAAAAAYIVQLSYSVPLNNQVLQQDASDNQALQQDANDGLVDFALPDLNGSERRLSDWNGEARLVNFWATWCAPCRREIPLLKQLQAEKSDKHLQVIGVAVDFMEDVQAYALEAEFNYPILVGQEEAMAAAESSGVDFIGLPFTMIVARDGTLVSTHMGEIKQEHVDLISGVMRDLDLGTIDIEGARKALRSP